MDAVGYNHLAARLVETAQKAGRAALSFYSGTIDVSFKADNSPVTAADQAAEELILTDLKKIAPEVPVIAEESVSAGNIPDTGDRFFLVDPLDGTKEFINRNGEFTVNIALIEHQVPIFGIVYAPAISDVFLTLAQDRAVNGKLEADGPDITLSDLRLTPIATRRPDNDGLIVVASRSHLNDETRTFLEKFTVTSMTSAGSSLKFCLLAKGAADLYPRLAPTNEWDTAAGDAVLRAAGGVVVTEDGHPLTYGKVDRRYGNPGFVAWGHPPK